MQFVHAAAHHDRAGGTEGVPHRHGAAVGVHPLGPGIEIAAKPQAQRGKRLSELEDVDVTRGQPGASEHLLNSQLAGGEHHHRIDCSGGGGHNARPRSDAGSSHGGVIAEQQQRRPVSHLRRGAHRVQVAQRSDRGMFGRHERVLAGGSDPRERRRQCG